MLICPRCGAKLRPGSAAQAGAPSPLPGSLQIPQLQPAGFWLRLGAFLVDALLLLPLLFIQNVAISFAAGGIIVWWLYFALFESSKWQATPGKRMVGLKVTDVNGVHITFGRASRRFFGRLLSAAILGVGFMMCAWTEHKQCLHDLLADTLVLRRS